MLSGSNTYTGQTTIAAGTVQVTTLSFAGSASSLGAATGSNATINLGGVAAATLAYVGGADATTNRGLAGFASCAATGTRRAPC